jgi:hypothetical protein
MEDDLALSREDRAPCPVCGSKARVSTTRLYENMYMTDSVDIQVTPAPAVIGEAHLAAAATLTASGEVLPKTKLTLLGLPVTHEIVLKFADLLPEPDPPCIIEIQSPEGDLLNMGAGLTPADALSSLFEQMLPESSSERINIADEPPLPDDEDDGHG